MIVTINFEENQLIVNCETTLELAKVLALCLKTSKGKIEQNDNIVKIIEGGIDI